MIVRLGVIVLGVSLSCFSTASPLEWSESQAKDLKGYYTARNMPKIKGHYKWHEARQRCANNGKHGELFYSCVGALRSLALARDSGALSFTKQLDKDLAYISAFNSMAKK